MEEAVRTRLEHFIEDLSSYKGRHTELVSVYVPAGYSLSMIASQLESEKATAQNIKSKTTRKNVLDALERLTRHLKLYKRTPPNGMALFSGNISRVEGQPRIEIWAIEPPLPLKTKLYRCDQTFLLDPLNEMLEAKDVYGLIVVDRKEATLGLLEGKSIKVLRKLTSGVPGKIKAGGQSAARFARLTETLAKEFYRRIGQAAKEDFYALKKLKGLLVGGPGPTKEDFLSEGQLVTALREKVLAVKDIGYTDEYGLKQLVEVSADVLAQEAITKEKELLKKFFNLLAESPDMVSYGIDETKKALDGGAVQQLLISKTLPRADQAALEKLAKKTGASTQLISTETDEGVEFKNLGGVGAFLRFPIAALLAE